MKSSNANDFHGTAQAHTVLDGRIRTARYARMSSDNQKKASIEDQFRECREAEQSKGWVNLPQFNQCDEEKTGQTWFNRAGLDRLMAIVKAKPKLIDYVIAADSSRLGRNAPETMMLARILQFHGVSLFFVEEQLDSNDRGFSDTFSREALEDERFSRSLGAKVQRGRRGRFLAGFNPGGGCYGYVNVPEEDHSRKGHYGRPAVVGVRQVIEPEAAAVVRRIFEAYGSGMSHSQIAKMLNHEHIQSPQEPRRKPARAWSKNTISSMLKNTRYIGEVRWNTTEEEMNPETGKKRRRKRPSAEWDVAQAPQLRIISDELWDKVQARRKHIASTLGIQKAGAMNRTEAARRYLLSGLLQCGACGGKIVIGKTRPVTRYVCSNHRYRAQCSNKTMIRQDVLESAFVSALASNLRSKEYRDYLVNELHEYLLRMHSRRSGMQREAESQREQLEANRASHMRHKANLLKAIRETGGVRSLYEDLKEIEAKIDRIDETLATAVETPVREISRDEVRDFVETEAHSFEKLLFSSTEVLKEELQKRIKTLTLTPVVEQNRVAYRVSGDVGLFGLPDGAMQPDQLYPIDLHYTIPVSCEVQPWSNHHRKGTAAVDLSPISSAVGSSHLLLPTRIIAPDAKYLRAQVESGTTQSRKEADAAQVV